MVETVDKQSNHFNDNEKSSVESVTGLY